MGASTYYWVTIPHQWTQAEQAYFDYAVIDNWSRCVDSTVTSFSGANSALIISMPRCLDASMRGKSGALRKSWTVTGLLTIASARNARMRRRASRDRAGHGELDRLLVRTPLDERFEVATRRGGALRERIEVLVARGMLIVDSGVEPR